MLKIGWSSASLVPDRPAMLQGQMHTRVARSAKDPVTVTAMAMEGGQPLDAAVIVSLDLALITDALMAGVRGPVARQLPKFNADKIIFGCTHTHDSYVYEDGFYVHPGGDVMTANECETLLAERTAAVVVEAWKNLTPARIARAFGHAVVAHNRRPMYADGSTQMYGRAANADFTWIEGPEDHSLDMLFIWDTKNQLVGILLDVPCPSQVEEHLSEFSADFWHETRIELRKRLGAKIWVLPLCGVAGDQSPHFIFDGKQEGEMRKRRGVSERQEIALRLADGVDRALAVTKPMEGDIALAHTVKRVTVSPRSVSKKESDWAAAEHARSVQHVDPKSWWPAMLHKVVDTYEGKHVPKPVPLELHFLRIGDAVLATNPFELYVDYGLRIKARSAAAQTFLSQVTCGTGWYLPTQRAVDGGGYGAMPAVCAVGPEGGQEFVEHTVKAIAELFPEKAKG